MTVRPLVLSLIVAIGVGLGTSASSTEAAEAPGLGVVEHIEALGLLNGIVRVTDPGSGTHPFAEGSPVRVAGTVREGGTLSVLAIDRYGEVHLVQSGRVEHESRDWHVVPNPIAELPAGQRYVLALLGSDKLADQLGELLAVRATAGDLDAVVDAMAGSGDLSSAAWSTYTTAPLEHIQRESAVAFLTDEALPSRSLDVMIQFDFDSDRLTDQARERLDEAALVLADPRLSGDQIVIEGHTDDVGPAEYNDLLSLRRANAVRHYLESAHGLDSKRLLVEGYGETRPLDPRDLPEARAVNRRAAFRVR